MNSALLFVPLPNAMRFCISTTCLPRVSRNDPYIGPGFGTHPPSNVTATWYDSLNVRAIRLLRSVRHHVVLRSVVFVRPVLLRLLVEPELDPPFPTVEPLLVAVK